MNIKLSAVSYQLSYGELIADERWLLNADSQSWILNIKSLNLYNMYEIVKTTLARQLRIDPERVTLDAQIKRDLGADSVDILQLLMRLEDDYGIVIPDQALAKFETVNDVVTYLDNLQKWNTLHWLSSHCCFP